MEKIDIFLIKLFLLSWGEREELPEKNTGASFCGCKILPRGYDKGVGIGK